jgi:hypothetical protein
LRLASQAWRTTGRMGQPENTKGANVNSSFSRGRIIIVAVTASALAAPAAQAYHVPSDRGVASSSTSATWTASSREIDRLGPKHVPLQHPIARAPITVVKVVKPAGFVWADAAIGAGVAGLALAVVAALTLAITRRGRKPGVPERSKLAGA